MLQSVQRRIQWSPSIEAIRNARTDLQIDAELVYPQGNCIPPMQSVAFHRMQFISVDKNHWLWSIFYNLKSYKIAQRQWKMKITLKGILDRHSIWQAGDGGALISKSFTVFTGTTISYCPSWNIFLCFCASPVSWFSSYFATFCISVSSILLFFPFSLHVGVPQGSELSLLFLHSP